MFDLISLLPSSPLHSIPTPAFDVFILLSQFLTACYSGDMESRNLLRPFGHLHALRRSSCTTGKYRIEELNTLLKSDRRMPTFHLKSS
jgi:hypothetical protein